MSMSNNRVPPDKGLPDRSRTEAMPVVRPVEALNAPDMASSPATVTVHKSDIHRSRRYIIDDSDPNQPVLSIVWYEKVKERKNGRRTSFWQEHEQRIFLDVTDLVNIDNATKIHLTFDASETRITYLRRLHWTSIVPIEALLLIGMILGIVKVFWFAELLPNVIASLATLLLTAKQERLAVWLQTSLPDLSGLLVPLSLLWVLACGAVMMWTWVKWAHTHLICTDMRIILAYEPPLKLPGKTPSAPLSRLQGCEAQSTFFGNIFGYGTIVSATAANGENDKWLEKGIRHVPGHDRLSTKLNHIK